MAYTRAQWNRFQAELPQEDRMSYEEYIASETPASTSTATTSTATTVVTPTATATAVVTPTATETPTATLSAAEIARLKAIEDAANAEYAKTMAAANESANSNMVNGKLMGPSAYSKDGKPLEFQPMTEGARLAIFGLNPATGKAYTDAESAALNGGYLPEGYKNLQGYRFDPTTGALEVLGGNGTTSGLGTGYRMNAKGNILPDQSRLPKGVGIDENGKYYQPGEVMPNESLAQYASRMSRLGGGNFAYKGKNYQFDENGMFYIPGEQNMPVGFGTPRTTSDAFSNTTMSNTTKSLVTGTSTNALGMNLPTGVTVTTTYLDPKTGDTVGVLSNGTTRVLTAGNKIATDRESTIAVLMDRFNKYGLTSLANKIKQLAIEGATEATITLQLQETPEYQQRFAANAERLKKGLSVLTPAEYVNVEDSYRQVLRAYGLKQFDNDAYVKQFIANDVSPTELSNRVVTAVQRVQNADPAITNQLKQYYGIGAADMVAYVLDPEQQFQKIERQIAASEIGVAAARQGLQAGVSVAEQLAAQGVSQAEAQKGYATIADILPTAEKLSDIYGTTLEGYGQAEGEQEVFNQLASAQRKRQKLTAREVAAFSGASGTNRTSLTTSTVGQF